MANWANLKNSWVWDSYNPPSRAHPCDNARARARLLARAHEARAEVPRVVG